MSRMLQMLARSQLSAPTTGGGDPLAPAVQVKMEKSFRHDFSSVRIHQGRTAADLGALAFTSGNNVHFAPGHYDPHSPHGQELLGHELAHIVQQSSGRVQPTVQGKGMAINDDASLEREADEAGARAARGEAVGILVGGSLSSSVVQGKFTYGGTTAPEDLLDQIQSYVERKNTEKLPSFKSIRANERPARELADWAEEHLDPLEPELRALFSSHEIPEKRAGGPPGDDDDGKTRRRPLRSRTDKKRKPKDARGSEPKPKKKGKEKEKEREKRKAKDLENEAEAPKGGDTELESSADAESPTLLLGQLIAPLAARAEASAKRKLLRLDKPGVDKLVTALNEAPLAGSDAAAPVFAGQSFFHQALAVEEATPRYMNFRPLPGITTNTRPLKWQDEQVAKRYAQLSAKEADSHDKPEVIKKRVAKQLAEFKKKVASRGGFRLPLAPPFMFTSGGGRGGGSYPALQVETNKKLQELRISLDPKKRMLEFLNYLQAPMKEMGLGGSPATAAVDARPEASSSSSTRRGTKRKRVASKAAAPARQPAEQQARAAIASTKHFVVVKHLARGIESFRHEGVFTMNGLSIAYEQMQERAKAMPSASSASPSSSSSATRKTPLGFLMADDQSIMSPLKATQWFYNQDENQRQMMQMGRIAERVAALAPDVPEEGAPAKRRNKKAASSPGSSPPSSSIDVIAPVAAAICNLKKGLLGTDEASDERAVAEKAVVDAMLTMNAHHEDLPAVNGPESPRMNRRELYTIRRTQPSDEVVKRSAGTKKRRGKSKVGGKQIRVTKKPIKLSQPNKDYQTALEIPVHELKAAFDKAGCKVNQLRTYLNTSKRLKLERKQVSDLLHVQGLKAQKHMKDPEFTPWKGGS